MYILRNQALRAERLALSVHPRVGWGGRKRCGRSAELAPTGLMPAQNGSFLVPRLVFVASMLVLMEETRN